MDNAVLSLYDDIRRADLSALSCASGGGADTNIISAKIQYCAKRLIFIIEKSTATIP
jgi:hypothetical protein